MIIKAIRMFDGGFMNQQFAFGGEEGKDKFDEQIIYRSSLQNFLIDTGSEVILVDTGFKTGYVAPAKKLGAPLYMGDKVADYMDALRNWELRFIWVIRWPTIWMLLLQLDTNQSK